MTQRNSLFQQIKLSTKNESAPSKSVPSTQSWEWVYDQAIKILSKQSFSEHELREALQDASPETLDEKTHIEPAFERLRRANVLADNRFVENMLERYPHKGNSFYYQQLRDKGISVTTIRAVMADKKIPAERERAFEVAQRKRIEAAKQDIFINVSDLSKFLAGRHFSMKTIAATIERLRQESQAKFKGGLFSSSQSPSPIPTEKKSHERALTECLETSNKLNF